MPSLLASAAMAALAGSGGRKLTTTNPCTHDICGRKLLMHKTAHGDPQFLKQTAAGFEDSDFNAIQIDMDENGHQLFGEPSVIAKISSGKVVIEASFNTGTGGYIHGTDTSTTHACQLIVTPSIIGGVQAADGTTDGKLTSATFNPSAGHATVDVANGVWAYNDPNNNAMGGKFTAEVADPVIVDASLGYLGLEYNVSLVCAHDKNGADPAPVGIYQYETDTSEVYQKLRARHKFVEASGNMLPLMSNAATPISLTAPAAQWGSGSHKKMPVNIQATTTVQTESGAVRFPVGEWDSGGAFGAQAKTSGAKLSCQINQGTLVTALNTVKGEWFNEHAGKVGGVSNGAAAVEQEYGGLTDVTCTSDTAGVSCGISYTATIVATTDRALGFQVPLASYYDGTAVPSVSCSETQNSNSESKTVDITGRGSYAIGNIKKSLAFTGLTPTISEYGEGFFDANSKQLVFGSGKLFNVEQAGEAAWYDLLNSDGTYDYQWQLKYKIVGDDDTEIDETGAGSTDTGLIASLGGSLSVVQGLLADKVTDASSGFIAKKFARPTLYGQERHEYSIKTAAATAAATAAFRRSKAEILLTITGQTDGTLDYDGKAADNSTNVVFPGYLETLTVGSTTITACDYCKEGTTGGTNDAVKLGTPALTGTEQAAEWQLFEDDNAGGKTDTTLFLQTAGICAGTSADATAWCKSKATADDATGRGTAVQCKEQSVTFQVTATMQDEDDRVASSSAVTRTYTDAAVSEPDKPTTGARAGIQYQLAGAKLTEKFTTVALATDTQGLGPQTFTRPHGDAQGYSCAEAAGSEFVYTAPYFKFCTGESDPIPYVVATNVVYSPAQVKVGATLKTGSAGTSADLAIREYDLQGRQASVAGVNITFTVTASMLKFDNTLEIKVKHAALGEADSLGVRPGFVTLSTADKSCVIVATGGASAECTLSGFTDDAFDPDDKLDIGDHCVATVTDADTEVACPSFSLEVSQMFNVPKTDGTVGAFQSAVVGPADTCVTSRRHIISLADPGSTADSTADSVAEDIVISINVDGSEEIHREEVELFATFGEGSNFNQKARFAYAAAESGTQSTGAHGEYKTIMTLGEETTLLPADMSELNLKLIIHGEDTDSGAVPYTLKNLDASYKMYICANGDVYDSCGTNEISSDGQTVSIWNGGQIPLFLRIDDTAGSGADPCSNKFKGVQAFGTEGIKISIARNGEQAHTYTVPITCHTPDIPTIGWVSGPSNNGINWNQEVLTVQVSGRSIDAAKQVTITGLSNTLESDVSVSLETDTASDEYRYAVLPLEFLKDNCVDATANVLFDTATPFTQALTCPASALGVYGVVRDSLVIPKQKFGDIFSVDMKMSGRDFGLYDAPVTLRAATGNDNSATGETVQFWNDNQASSTLSIPDSGNTTVGPKEVFFRIYPKAETGVAHRIQCNFIEIELQAYTVWDVQTQTGSGTKKFQFRVACPRQQSGTAAADSLALNYDVDAFSFGASDMSITLPANPSGLTSVSGLGKCSGTGITLTAGCELNVGANALSGGEAGLDLFDACAQKSGDGTAWGKKEIVSKATVARRYTKAGVAGSAFTGADYFCGETPLTVVVTKTTTKTIAIAVADNNDMRFDVQMSQLEWAGDNTCGSGQYRLQAAIEMKRQLGTQVNGAFAAITGEDYVSTGIESYYRTLATLANVEYYKDTISGTGIAHDAYTTDTGSTMLLQGPCQIADNNARVLGFTMRVEIDGVEYFSLATVTFQVQPPDANTDVHEFVEADTTKSTECVVYDSAFPGTECPAGAVASNFQVKLSVGVSTGEAAAFLHSYSEPRIKQSALSADDGCDLFADCPLVSGLLPLTSYQAKIGSVGQDLVQGTGENANSIVMLKTVPFAGDTDVQIGWTISRVENTGGAGRRLRSVQHVAYTLGADGSVSKSSSFAVLPAVRDSDDASAVTTKEQITLEELDADGNIVYSEVYNQTTVEYEKSGEDHTLAVLGIVFGGLGSAAAIAVAFFVGCASRKDAQGVGSSFKTVAGGFSDRRPLFNRNRFAPSDF